MSHSFGATTARAPARPLERKDETGNDVKDLDKKAIGEFMGAWGEFQKANDERLKGIEGKFDDVVTNDKLKKIEGTLDKFEGINQKLTQLDGTKEALADLDKKFGILETAINRTTNKDQSPEEKMTGRSDWARAVVLAHQQGTANLPEAQQKALSDVIEEYKALNIGTNTEGGYLAPVDMVRDIIKAVTEISPVRSLARVRQTGMKSVEIPKRTGQFAAQWVAEQGTKAETEGLTWGIEEITTHEMFALIDITNQMLEDTVFNIPAEIEEESAEQFALAEGAAFVNGTGVGKPQGFMQHADVGFTNSGSATTIADVDGQADGLLQMKYSLKTAYARNATFVMNRTTMGQVRRLKDGDKNYIWMPGLALGRPNTIDGDPYVEMPDMQNAGAGTFPIAYGDFRRAYTWVDRLAMEMLRDPYTQATSGKIRYIMRKRVAGKVTLAEAIKKLKCAA
ncbi:phage major capsid protein [Sulfitobacter sp. EhC04]|uniref:phage major capsid protein n=1 Tax=Sulfitobacter sp. EhC04 TaxID=1849168 RepID=UPI0009EED3EF|nr:phage major capsid protein [Sulfitobacter sp. EhC04]